MNGTEDAPPTAPAPGPSNAPGTLGAPPAVPTTDPPTASGASQPQPIFQGEPRRRVHPLSPLLHGAKSLVVIVAALSWQTLSQVGFERFALVVLVLALGAGVVALISWLNTGYHLVGRELRIQEGLLWRRNRAIPLERLQAVEVVRPLLAQLTGLAELRLEVVGRGKTEAPLAYLSVRDAAALRERLLALAGRTATTPPPPYPGLPYPGSPYPGQPYPSASPPGHPYPGRPYPSAAYPGAAYPGQAYPDAAYASQPYPGQPYPGQSHPGQPYPVQPYPGQPYPGQPYPGQLYPGQLHLGQTYPGAERPLHAVSNTDLLFSQLLTPQAFLLPVGVAFVLLQFALEGSWSFIGIASTATAMAGVLLQPIRRVLQDWNFRVSGDAEGRLAVRYGLLETRNQTVPPHRVQALGATWPLLWRGKRWLHLRIDIAGYAGPQPSDDKRSDRLLPVGDLTAARMLVAEVLPGVDLTAIAVGTPPPRARWLHPFALRAMGAGLTAEVFATRSGLLARELTLVPYARMQSVRVVQGPLQRVLRLATVYADTAGGRSGAAYDRDVGEAWALAAELSRRAELARTVHRTPTGAPSGPQTSPADDQVWQRQPGTST